MRQTNSDQRSARRHDVAAGGSAVFARSIYISGGAIATSRPATPVGPCFTRVSRSSFAVLAAAVSVQLRPSLKDVAFHFSRLVSGVGRWPLVRQHGLKQYKFIPGKALLLSSQFALQIFGITPA